MYCGEFLEIARGGVSRWPGKGRVVGLMLRSTDRSGVFRLAVTGRALRKNAQSSMREIVPKLMLLHYVKRQPLADDDLEISMPNDEARLSALPQDRSLLEQAPEAPFAEQTLDIAAVIFWRGAPLLRRLAAAYYAKRDAGFFAKGKGR